MNRKQRRAGAKSASAHDAGLPARDGMAAAMVALQAGRIDQAEAACRRLLAARADHAEALALLSVIAAQREDYAAALAMAQRAVEARPDWAPAQFALGVALRKLDRDLDAAQAYAAAVRLEPGNRLGHYNLANTLEALGRRDEAIAAYRRALDIDPTQADVWTNLGRALEAGGDGDAALDAYASAARLAPADARVHYNLANALHGLGRGAQAIESYRLALAIDPDYADAWNNLGNALRTSGRDDEAAEAYRAALATKPDYDAALFNLAETLQTLGRLGEALGAAREGLQLDPRSARGWFILSDLKTFGAGDPDLAQMQALQAAAPLDDPLDARLNLAFALAKALADAGDMPGSLDQLIAANRQKRASLDYDVEQDVARFAAIAAAFPASALARPASGAPEDTAPVFVVGMPRSGTSLVEQILASHPETEGAGELKLFEAALAAEIGERDVETAYPRIVGELSPAQLAAIGRRYLDGVRGLAPGAARVVDKMPANFQMLGLIRLALPGARIIHCRRDPVETCLSCFARKFSDGQAFSYDLGDLGRYYRGYAGLMAHWRAVLPPDRFCEVDYEAVVGNLEGQARRLMDFIGLAWDPACLEFHQTSRPVRTASASQVRRPIYRTSLARWQPYRGQLQPLLAALEGNG